MSQNPYAPPSAAPEPSYRTRSGTDEPNIGEALSESWNAMTENWGVAIVAYVLFSILITLSIVTVLGAFLLAPILFAGYHFLLLRIVDDEAELGDMFEGFSRYGDLLGPVLVYALVCFIAQLPSSGLSVVSYILDEPSLNTLGSVVGLMVYVFATARLTFAHLLVDDIE
ncbi:MAG: hypothetical protein AAF449_12635, partial [Myxococcota bacterium]